MNRLFNHLQMLAVISTFGFLIHLLYNAHDKGLKYLNDVKILSEKTVSLPIEAPIVRFDTTNLINNPLFVMTVGPKAYKNSQYQIMGISISPKRKAVLLSIDSATPRWVDVGGNIGDSRVVSINSDHIKIDTPIGIKDVYVEEVQNSQSSTNPSN